MTLAIVILLGLAVSIVGSLVIGRVLRSVNARAELETRQDQQGLEIAKARRRWNDTIKRAKRANR